MSMSSWSVTGIGFTVNKCDPSKVAIFLLDHFDIILINNANRKTSTIRKGLEEIANTGVIYESISDDLYELLNFPVSEFIARIMNNMLSINNIVSAPACSDTYLDEHVLYIETYPWGMTEKEKKMTYKDIQGAMINIATNFLGYPRKDVPYEFQSETYEYYG